MKNLLELVKRNVPVTMNVLRMFTAFNQTLIKCVEMACIEKQPSEAKTLEGQKNLFTIQVAIHFSKRPITVVIVGTN